jgi:hypothetical protein
MCIRCLVVFKIGLGGHKVRHQQKKRHGCAGSGEVQTALHVVTAKGRSGDENIMLRNQPLREVGVEVTVAVDHIGEAQFSEVLHATAFAKVGVVYHNRLLRFAQSKSDSLQYWSDISECLKTTFSVVTGIYLKGPFGSNLNRTKKLAHLLIRHQFKTLGVNTIVGTVSLTSGLGGTAGVKAAFLAGG